MKLNPIYLEKDGKKEFVVLPVADFNEMKELLEDMEDLMLLNEAMEEPKNEPSISLANAKKHT